MKKIFALLMSWMMIVTMVPSVSAEEAQGADAAEKAQYTEFVQQLLGDRTQAVKISSVLAKTGENTFADNRAATVYCASNYQKISDYLTELYDLISEVRLPTDESKEEVAAAMKQASKNKNNQSDGNFFDLAFHLTSADGKIYKLVFINGYFSSDFPFEFYGKVSDPEKIYRFGKEKRDEHQKELEEATPEPSEAITPTPAPVTGEKAEYMDFVQQVLGDRTKTVKLGVGCSSLVKPGVAHSRTATAADPESYQKIADYMTDLYDRLAQIRVNTGETKQEVEETIRRLEDDWTERDHGSDYHYMVDLRLTAADGTIYTVHFLDEYFTSDFPIDFYGKVTDATKAHQIFREKRAEIEKEKEEATPTPTPSTSETPSPKPKDVVDLENHTYNGNPMRVIETFTFDLKPTDSQLETIRPFGAVASSGTVISASIEQVGIPMSPPVYTYYYILSFSGDKGTKQYYSQITPEFGAFTGDYRDQNWYFPFNGDLEYDKETKSLEKVPCNPWWQIRVYGSAKDKTVKSARIAFFSGNSEQATVSAENLSYQFLWDNMDARPGSRNLTTLWSGNRAPESMGLGETVPTLPPSGGSSGGGGTTVKVTPTPTPAPGTKEKADQLNKLGLFRGTDKGYELNKTLTREESATMLVRLLGKEERAKELSYVETFDDVEAERWSFKNVMYCYAQGITKGRSETEFAPADDVTADEFVTLTLRLMGYTDAEPSTAYEKAVKIGLLTQAEANELKKDDFVRGSMVSVVYNALSTKTESGTTLLDFLKESGAVSKDASLK